MRKKLLLVGIVVIIAVAGAVFAFEENNDDIRTPAELGSFMAEEVARHDSFSDCWTIIQGNVYDLTEFIPSHPGGNEILRACGTDATLFFKKRLTAEDERIGSGLPHSSAAEEELSRLQIGILEE